MALLLPEPSERTSAGVLAVTGALAAVAGATLTEPTWTVPIELFAVWSPEPGDAAGEDADAAGAPPELVAVLLPPVDATFTGAFAVAGALTAVAGAALTEPIWTVPIEPLAVWPAPDAGAGAVVAAVDGAAAELPAALSPPSEATLTGAFAVTGALAVVAGATFTEPTWTVPSDCVAD